MTESKHTPGPWNNSDDGRIYATGEIIADATYGCLPRAETDSNTRLIAAAPDLLAALQVIANCVADSEGGVTLGSYEQGIVRAAIRKAKGE